MELNYSKIKKFIPVLLILGFVLILYFLIFPAYGEIHRLKSAIKIKQADLEQLALLAELKQSKEFEKLDVVLPSKPEIPELMLQLETIASKNSLILKSINFTENQDNIIAQIALAGNYNSFKNYVQALENNLRLIDVMSINFQAPKTGSLYNFNLFIKAYYGSRQETKNITD